MWDMSELYVKHFEEQWNLLQQQIVDQQKAERRAIHIFSKKSPSFGEIFLDRIG
jgi:hypothetical protein